MKYTVKQLEQTCSACPSQWEGTTECGKDIYIRYRWGSLSLKINGKQKFTAYIGNELDGVIGIEDIQNYLKDYLKF